MKVGKGGRRELGVGCWQKCERGYGEKVGGQYKMEGARSQCLSSSYSNQIRGME